MSIAAHRKRRSIVCSWLLRSQPSSPLFSSTKANRLLARYQDLISGEVFRMGLDIEVEEVEDENAESE